MFQYEGSDDEDLGDPENTAPLDGGSLMEDANDEEDATI